MSPTDEELARSAGDGNHDAFADLVTAHQRKVYGLALHLLRDPHDAADAAQETFMRCFTSLHTFDATRSFGAWAYRIAYNHCLDVLRQRKRSPTVTTPRSDPDSAPYEVPDPGPGVEELVERVESVRGVQEALRKVSDEHNHVLALRYTLDLSYADIAEILQVPESTITMRLHHAKRALRSVLSDSGEGTYATS